MSFVEPGTRVIRPSSSADTTPVVLVKDTCTVEDVLFAYTRAKAVSKKNGASDIEIPSSVRLQITRVPYVR